MFSENGVLVDFEEVSRLVAEADVFAVGFANFRERLLVDKRSNGRETPLVQVVVPARSPRDRIGWLVRRRPSLGAPQAFSFLPWPHSPSFLVESGVWERICRSVGAGQEPEVRIQCELAIGRLEDLETEAAQSVLRGDHCLTLWPREPEEPDF